MTVQPVRYFGDPVLRERAVEVTTFDRELRQLVADLDETMREQGGAGLAAPQIGVGLRVFTYRVGEDQHGHLVNPTWTVLDETEQTGPEGCLSIPGHRWDCTRYDNVVARGWDSHGEPLEIEGTAMLARAIQHETDHLDGVLFLDRLDPATRKAAMAEIRQAPWFDPTAPPRIKQNPHAGRRSNKGSTPTGELDHPGSVNPLLRGAHG